uniref:Beta-defensin n=1 Tax=Callithrix jacchus TaxID=9483 RepID=A0A5F4WG91_CALJA
MELCISTVSQKVFENLSSVTMRLHFFLTALFAIFQLLPGITRALNFERPCYLRGGICLKQGTPDCEPFRGPCRVFTVCCKIRRS